VPRLSRPSGGFVWRRGNDDRRFAFPPCRSHCPCGGVPALADEADTGEPDRIFALIDAARLAKAAHIEAQKFKTLLRIESGLVGGILRMKIPS
jgi:hypothetical protein